MSDEFDDVVKKRMDFWNGATTRRKELNEAIKKASNPKQIDKTANTKRINEMLSALDEL